MEERLSQSEKRAVVDAQKQFDLELAELRERIDAVQKVNRSSADGGFSVASFVLEASQNFALTIYLCLGPSTSGLRSRTPMSATSHQVRDIIQRFHCTHFPDARVSITMTDHFHLRCRWLHGVVVFVFFRQTGVVAS